MRRDPSLTEVTEPYRDSICRNEDMTEPTEPYPGTGSRFHRGYV